MSLDVVIVLSVLVGAIALFVTELVRAELVALLVMLTLALSGVLEGTEAIAGFSNPAVVTVASMFVLSGGLARTGVAHFVSAALLRASGKGSPRLSAVTMLAGGLLSGIMNNVAVVGLLMPAVLEVARRTGLASSQLLMPLAMGSLLGGMTTLIGTNANILLAAALRDAGMEPFGMFDFLPVGLSALLLGVAFVALLGHRVLPRRDPKHESAASIDLDLKGLYELGQVLCTVTLEEDSSLAGRTLGESRLGRALGLNVLAVSRRGQMELAPGSEHTLLQGDRLLVEGRLDRLETLRAWRHLDVEAGEVAAERLAGSDIALSEVEVLPESDLVGSTLSRIDMRRRFDVYVLAVGRGAQILRAGLRDHRLEAGDRLVVAGKELHFDRLAEELDLEPCPAREREEIITSWHLAERLQTVRVPDDSRLGGQSLGETRLGEAFNQRILAIFRGDEAIMLPDASVTLEGGDVLLVQGRRQDLDVLEALQELSVGESDAGELEALESEEIGLAEATLSPRTAAAGTTLTELRFRERYGLSVLAIWRSGRAHYSNLAQIPLQRGDALLLYGPRSRMSLLAQDPDFFVIGEERPETLRNDLAPLAVSIMAGVVAAVTFGWLPIFIAAPAGATLMVLAGCLRIEEVYELVELRILLIIAGMLSLGLAMETTGAARLLADSALVRVAGLGPWALIAGLFLVTSLCVQVMPSSAVAVLMAPVALTAAADLQMSPRTLLIVVAVACSSAFVTPVGHPVNLLVMGFGGYRYRDYVRAGLPLLGVTLLAVLVVVPLVWPLRG